MFLRYVRARFNQQQRDWAYRFYIADNLRIIGENSAKFSGGSFFKAKLSDILYPAPQDNRTGDEIAADVIEKIGLEVKD